MAIYAIGDIQGCARSLERLLELIRFDPSLDRLWCVGDLVNRGPDSLRSLRYLKQLGPAAQVVLGNHDLFLLAVSEGIVALRPKDTIQDILAADDRTDVEGEILLSAERAAELVEDTRRLEIAPNPEP